ncbi:hypothetical protein QYE76_050951 [Lolium multiflorum]|uniref:Transposase (putative) gypsy type domain-containing protein n=1 Tax=Lolium multiflorum TaxID=4521 RepID=A0AAD8SSI1_LOLMU|nr:hypothetical protein QYE76_050951 [Lolium multiflorum]
MGRLRSDYLHREVKIRLLLPGLDFIHLDLQQLGRPMGHTPPSPSMGHPGLPDIGHAVDIPINGAQRTKSGDLDLVSVTGNRHAIAAENMSTSSPKYTDSSPNSPEPNSVEPKFIEPIAFLPPNISDKRLAQPFSASSSNYLNRIPTLAELQEEIEGQARMAAKVQEAEQKKASKVRNREGEKGQWWPCEVKDTELRDFQTEGMIAPDWSFMKDSPHNICPNSYLLLSNFVTLCEGHLGIRPDIRLWQFFFRVKKETKDKAMVNCGSMTFMLRPGRMYPPQSSHESVRYWNAGWFYAKNIEVPDVHEGLPKFINKPPEELASWSFVPALAQFPILEKAARRISWLVHDGLTGTDLTLSWFSHRIQPLKYNKRLICEYYGVDDPLRVTRDNLSMDSLKRRIKTLVKITQGQPVPKIVKDIKTNNQCPPLNSLAEEDFRSILRVPTSADAVEEDPEDDDEEEEQAPKKFAPRTVKRPRAKVSRSEAGASGEASAKRAKTKPPPLNLKKAERKRLKPLSTTGKGPRPLIPGAT